MKTRSKALFVYLQQTGVLDGTPEAIALAKKRYRAHYKKLWKQQRLSQKEVRITFTIEQYTRVTNASSLCAQKSTNYARELILSAVDSNPFIADKETLLTVLQLLSMAINSLQNNDSNKTRITDLLTQAEQVLLAYLNKYNYEKRTKNNF